MNHSAYHRCAAAASLKLGYCRRGFARHRSFRSYYVGPGGGSGDKSHRVPPSVMRLAIIEYAKHLARGEPQTRCSETSWAYRTSQRLQYTRVTAATPTPVVIPLLRTTPFDRSLMNRLHICLCGLRTVRDPFVSSANPIYVFWSFLQRDDMHGCPQPWARGGTCCENVQG